MTRDRAGEAPLLAAGDVERIAVLDERERADGDDAGAAAAPAPLASSGGPAAEPAAPRPSRAPAVRRVRDLPRRARWWALAVAVALTLAPAAAFAHFVPGWSATSDPALMGLRSLDVGTARTPLLGQPSQSGLYADSVASVHHPGPLHFYLMAAPVRLLGPAVGMPLVSVLVTGSCLVVAGWVVFRLLGARAALVASAALALVAFTTGAASLVNPVSSGIAGYPLLATAVLMWAVAAGDVRLLPLATAAASFTAQQHLAVVPATLVLCVGGLGIGAVVWWRDGRGADPASRRDLRRAALVSGGLGLVLWSPVLLQQAFGDAGNLGEMLWFARHGNGDTVGPAAAVRQVAHAVGLPPLLGRTDADGWLMLSQPSPLTWVSAAGALGLVAVLTWRTRADRARTALGAMVGVVVVAGLVNGSSVPDGLEKTRLAFYHWAFVLAFMVVVAIGLAASELIAPARRLGRPRVRPALAAAVALAVAAVGVTSPVLDRPQNTAGAAYSAVPAGALDRAVDDVLAHRDELGRHTLLVSRGETTYGGISVGLALLAAQRGLELKLPLLDRFFVHDRRLVDRDRLDGGLVLVAAGLDDHEAPAGGELVSRVTVGDPFPSGALARLQRATAGVDDVVFGPATEAAIQEIDDPDVRAITTYVLATIVDRPETALVNPIVLDVLARAPLASPRFDPHDVRAVRDGLHRLDTDEVSGRISELRVYLLDRDEMLAFTSPVEVGSP